MIPKPLLALIILILGSLLSALIGGIKLVLIFIMFWVDKTIFSELKMPLHFGIELYSLAAILTGIIYGPLTGFLFGFLLMPVIGGIFDILYTISSRSGLLDSGVEPFIPSFESLVTGAIAALAAMLSFLPFLPTVALCMAMRVFAISAKDALVGEPINIAARIINFSLNMILAFQFEFLFITTLGLSLV